MYEVPQYYRKIREKLTLSKRLKGTKTTGTVKNPHDQSISDRLLTLNRLQIEN